MIKKKYYTDLERTKAQFKAIDFKRKGYNIIRIVNDTDVIAFGYKKSNTSRIKNATEVDHFLMKEEDFDFIYWN